MKLLPKCIWKTIFLFLAAYGVAINVNTLHKVFVDSVVSRSGSKAENILQGNVAGLRIKN